MSKKLLLFDLDQTLLQTDKTISKRTLCSLNRCRKQGYLIGISTSRSEQNCIAFLNELSPEILISSGGALVKKNGKCIYKAVFSEERTIELIQSARDICGEDCEITIDTEDTHFWNYRVDPQKKNENWGESVWTDYIDFSERALKMCVEIRNPEKAKQLEKILNDCDSIRFSGSCWYQYTKKGISKEKAIDVICGSYEITCEDIIAFGDDCSDIGMLKIAGIGVAMGNALDEVKKIADIVIGTNDNEGIAIYLDSILRDKFSF